MFQRIPFQLPVVLAFQVRKLTTLSAALPHPSSASLHPESKLRILVTSNAGFLTSTFTEFKLRNPRSKLRNPSRRRLHQQHCHIHFRLHCIRNPIFEFWSHQTPGSSHPPSRNSSFAIQGPSFGIQAGFIKPPWQVHASFVTSPSRNPFRPLQPSIHVQSAAFDALAEPSPSCYTHMLQTMVANESARLGESGRGRQVRAGTAAK